MKNNLLKIIEHYGVMHQLRKFNEESFELIEAIINRENDYGCSDTSIAMIKNDEKHIIEEIADILVMLHQFIEYYKIQDSDIYMIMEQKINRQLERIAEEDNNE